MNEKILRCYAVNARVQDLLAMSNELIFEGHLEKILRRYAVNASVQDLLVMSKELIVEGHLVWHLTAQIAHNWIHAKEHDWKFVNKIGVTSNPNEHHKGTIPFS